MSALRVGEKAPDFRIKGILRGDVTDYALTAYAGKWLVLFFYPADFTFICPTEVTGFSKVAKDFAAENAAILGASVDSSKVIFLGQELGGLKYPLLSDESKKLSRDYGVLDETDGVSLRATFIINPTGHLLSSRQNVNVGRSVEETLRV